MNQQPLFTIVTPTRNRLTMLKEAVGSALNQTYTNIEIIILNNASNDGTQEWLDKLAAQEQKVHVVHHQKNLGFTGNIKSILNYVNGKYLVILSDDDTLMPNFAQEAVLDFGNHHKAVVWYSRVNFIDKTNAQLTHISQMAPPIENGITFIKESLKGNRETFWCATVYSVNALQSVGGFLGNGLAIDFISTGVCAAKGDVIFNEKIMSNYNFHPKNLTTKSSRTEWFLSYQEMSGLIQSKIKHDIKYTCARCCFSLYENMFNEASLKEKLKYFIYGCKSHSIFFIWLLIIRAPFLIGKYIVYSLCKKIKSILW